MAVSPIDRSVRVARSRLLRQAFVNHLGIGWAVALALTLAWFVAQPMLLENPPPSLRWIVLGAGLSLGLFVAIVRTRMGAPTDERVALEIDSRFQLRERITTAMALPGELRNSSAGRALFADAESKLAPLNLSEKFPLEPRRHLLGIPVLALALGAVVLWWNPEALGLTTITDEENAALKLPLHRSEESRQLQNTGGAGGVVVRARMNLANLRRGERIDVSISQVIVMSADDDVLVGLAREVREHIVYRGPRALDIDVQRNLQVGRKCE